MKVTPFLAGGADRPIECSRRDRPRDNDIGAGLGHGVDLLLLGLGVAARRLDFEGHPVLVGLGLRDRAQQVRGRVHPRVAVETRADIDFQFLLRVCSRGQCNYG